VDLQSVRFRMLSFFSFSHMCPVCENALAMSTLTVLMERALLAQKFKKEATLAKVVSLLELKPTSLHREQLS